MSKAEWKTLSALCIFAAAALAGNGSQAADLGPGLKDSYERPALLWQGFYAGLNGGGMLDGEARYDFAPGAAVVNDTNSVDLAGVTVGAHGGYNAQFGRFVIGAEVDFNFAKTDDPKECIFVGQARCETDISELYTARLRLGVTLRDDILLYGTGGLALANVKHVADFGGQPFEDKNTVDGIVYGGGLEFMHRSGVTFGVEVLHYDFEKESFNLMDNFGGTIPTDIDMDSTVVRARVGLQFN